MVAARFTGLAFLCLTNLNWRYGTMHAACDPLGTIASLTLWLLCVSCTQGPLNGLLLSMMLHSP